MTMTNRTVLLRSLFLAIALLFVGSMGVPGSAVFGVEAAQAQTVRQITVTGNERVDRPTVISFLAVRVGEVATSARIAASVDALQASRLFRTVSVTFNSGTLRVAVSENPIVASVLFEGNSRFTDEQLVGMIGTGTRGVYTEQQLAADSAAIEHAYDTAGYSNVTVTVRTEVLENARVRVVFNVAEGDKAGIKAINFTGISALSAGQLKDVMQTKETHLLSWLLNDDSYDPAKLEVDKERIRLAYANEGYPDAQVLSAVAEFDAEQNAYFISIAISEGEQYTFGEISIETSIDGLNTDPLRAAVRTHKGALYSFADLQRTVQDVGYRAVTQGHNFTDVRPRIDRDIANRTFNITYLVDQGPRIYVERINIYGNQKTRDFVIRREVEFAEGDPFNRALLSRSKTSIEELGYFSQVEITTEIGSASDRVIINIAVIEESSGEYGATVGYSTKDGILGEVSLTERNFLGRGQYLRIAIGASQTGRNFTFAFREPHFMGLDISAGINASHVVVDESTTFFYGSQRSGGTIVFGVPITDQVSVDLFAGGYRTQFIDTTGPTSGLVTDGQVLIKAVGGYTLTFNGVDNPRDPTEGIYATLTQQYGGWNHSFLATEGAARVFMPVGRTGIVASLKAQGGIMVDFSGAGVHATEAYRLGPTLVRGFASNGMGPRLLSGESTGYTMYGGVSAEIEAPVPVIPESWGLSVAAWADAGYVSGAPGTGLVIDPLSVDNPFKASVGGSIIWDSFIGPIRGDFAYVLSQATKDSTQIFQLTLSSLL